MWAGVLDADAFKAFEEAGDPFDRATAERLLAHVYSAGDRVEPRQTYRNFRGRDPAVEPMLEKIGLLPEPAAA
jgi:peptidyl-dipeptidase Dcp